jgi:hypothetical protein
MARVSAERGSAPGGRPTRAVLGTVGIVSILSIGLMPACGRISRHISGTGSSTRHGTLSVSPPSGPIGTTFSLTAGGLKPGEPMTFEIDPPKGARFVGPIHAAGPDGRVATTYASQPNDTPGTYRVKAVGSQGTRAEAQLILQR